MYQHPTFGLTLDTSSNVKRCLQGLPTCLEWQMCGIRCGNQAPHVCLSTLDTHPSQRVPQNDGYVTIRTCLIRTSRQENKVQKNLFLQFRSTAFDRDTFFLLFLFFPYIMADTYTEIPLADNVAKQRTEQFEEFLKFDVNGPLDDMW